MRKQKPTGVSWWQKRKIERKREKQPAVPVWSIFFPPGPPGLLIICVPNGAASSSATLLANDFAGWPVATAEAQEDGQCNQHSLGATADFGETLVKCI